jgi:hypothetical protein
MGERPNEYELRFLACFFLHGNQSYHGNGEVAEWLKAYAWKA